MAPYTITDVVFDKAAQKASVILDPLHSNRLPRLTFSATRTRDDRWVVDIARLRDDDIQASAAHAGATMTRLDAALQYLTTTFGLPRGKLLNYIEPAAR